MDIPVAIETGDLTTTYPDDDVTGHNYSGNYSDDYWLPDAKDLHILMNVTRDVPLKYAMPLFGYIMPFLLLVTIIANTLIVVVLAQRHMRTPTNLVLLAMAISDLLTLLFPAPWYFYMYTLNHHSDLLFPPSTCYAYHSMIEAVPAFFHTASIWLTLLLAVQRYIYVCHPTTARTCCTVPKVWRAMAWVYVLAFVHQSTRFFDRVFEAVRFRWRGGIHEGCIFMTAQWVTDTITENIYYTMYYGFRILFVHVGPCLALVIFNVLLFWALRKAQLKRQKLFKENRKSECKKLRDSNCTTLMLIVVVTVFLAVEIPLAVTTLLHVMQNALDLHIADYDDLNSTILFTNFFIMLSYPVNFAIYCGMSRQFRETFKDLFLQGKIASGREGSSRYSLVNGPRTSTNETIL
ncbi:sex peptide receptor-like [Stegodyphus dumicola]|uniref:sex peptide receptor-like n=1 Tax=Stegodyphus dumicola TaxID=202533 RepID=UPI0015B01F88|nr:sex peptide receptor-like [Stegodyphus dumicola]XP_035227227.1 sex peptide receptor-like [Stegodyphus dumicola]